MHSVRNDGDVDRVVLLLDVWNPELRGDAISKIRSQCASRAFTQGFDSHFDLTPRPRMSSSDSDPPYDYMMKTICIGDQGVGKTCLVLRMADLDIKEPWTDGFISTTGASFKVATYQVRSLIVKFQCWDVAGPERYRSITSSFCQGVHIMFLVIDTTDFRPVSDVLGAP
jgi:hypothetical protein